MPVRKDRRRGGADVLDTRRGGRGVGTPAVSPTIKDFNVWLRTNGVDVANSNSIQSMTDINEREVVSFTQILELEAGDYFEIMFAVNDINVFLNYIAATVFGPATPSISVNVTQVR